MRSSRFRLVIWSALSCFLALCCAACAGGGTIGTEPRTLTGQIIRTDDTPIEGANITVLATGDSALSDAAGRFSIATEIKGSSSELLVEVGTFERIVSVTGIPSGSGPIAVRVEVDQIGGIVSAVVVDSIDTPQPTGTPSVVRHQRFSALTTNKLGKPLAGVELRIPARRAGATSDPRGSAVISTTGAVGSVKFTVRYHGLSGGFTLRNIPSDRDTAARLTIRLTIEEGQIDPGTGKPRHKLHIDFGTRIS